MHKLPLLLALRASCDFKRTSLHQARSTSYPPLSLVLLTPAMQMPHPIQQYPPDLGLFRPMRCADATASSPRGRGGSRCSPEKKGAVNTVNEVSKMASEMS